MSVPTNTQVIYNAIGLREDLENIIYDITPTETPLLTMAGRTTAKNRKHEWQTDKLAAATKDNKVIEGDTPSADAAVRTNRIANFCQLMDKVVSVSSTEKAVDAAGRADEMAYQMAKRSLELKKDLDAALSQNNAATAGSTATAAQMAGLEGWLMYAGTGGAGSDGTHAGTCVGAATKGTTYGAPTATGYVDTAPVDSSSCGTLTEAIFRNVLARSCNLGGECSIILTSPTTKQQIAKNFAGIATRYREVPRGQAAIVGGADLYVSDFGEMTLRYSRQIRTDAGSGDGLNGSPVFGLNPELLNVAYLQPFREVPLAKVGHSDQRMLSVEATLVVKNPLGLFKIGDVGAVTA